jgi:hypothetical protein
MTPENALVIVDDTLDFLTQAIVTDKITGE